MNWLCVTYMKFIIISDIGFTDVLHHQQCSWFCPTVESVHGFSSTLENRSDVIAKGIHWPGIPEIHVPLLALILQLVSTVLYLFMRRLLPLVTVPTTHEPRTSISITVNVGKNFCVFWRSLLWLVEFHSLKLFNIYLGNSTDRRRITIALYLCLNLLISSQSTKCLLRWSLRLIINLLFTFTGRQTTVINVRWDWRFTPWVILWRRRTWVDRSIQFRRRDVTRGWEWLFLILFCFGGIGFNLGIIAWCLRQFQCFIRLWFPRSLTFGFCYKPLVQVTSVV